MGNERHAATERTKKSEKLNVWWLRSGGRSREVFVFLFFLHFCTLLRFSHVSLDVGVCVTKGKVIFSSLGVEKGVDGLYWKKIPGTNCIHKYYSKPNILKKTKQRHGINGMAQYDIADLCALKHTPLGCAVTLGLLGGFTSLWLSWGRRGKVWAYCSSYRPGRRILRLLK